MKTYSQNYDSAFNKLMTQEGLSYTNNPDDHGGPTKFGLTQKFLSEFNHRDVTIEEIQKIGIEEAKEIYYKAFWEPNDYENFMDLEISFLVFSFAVNSGHWNANSTLQKAANILYGKSILKVDGIIGKETLRILVYLNHEALAKIFICLAVDYYRQISKHPRQSKFLPGWIDRLYE